MIIFLPGLDVRMRKHAEKDSDDMGERATVPTADAAVNSLRKHFIHHSDRILKRSQPGILL